MSTGPDVVIVADAEAVAVAGAARVLAALRASVGARGIAHVALTGGSTAAPLYERLAESGDRGAADWGTVHCWWGDERFVPLDHPSSNAGVALDVLGGRLRVPAANLHPWPVAIALGRGEGPATAAAAYGELVRAAIPLDARGDPIFDLLLLGVGPDGHVLACFPGSPAFGPHAPLTLAIPAPGRVEPHLPRVTFRPSVIGAARSVLVLAAGAAKAAALTRALTEPLDPATLPVQSARVSQATWLLDRAAGAGLAT
jgi:6-phosphogluconolactonase